MHFTECKKPKFPMKLGAMNLIEPNLVTSRGFEPPTLRAEI